MSVLLDDIAKLKKLFDDGAISEEEYELLKAKILDNTKDEALYRIILTRGNQLQGFVNNLNYNALLTTLADRDISSQKLPALIADGLSIDECNMIQERLSAFGCITIIEKDEQSISKNNYLQSRNISDLPGEKRLQRAKEQPRCPKCSSTSITTGARGVNWTFGLIGASKTVNRCANCGYTWKPKG